MVDYYDSIDALLFKLKSDAAMVALPLDIFVIEW